MSTRINIKRRKTGLSRRNMGAGEFDLSDWMVGTGPTSQKAQ